MFGPDSAAWALDREAMLLLGAGPRALLLQLAHPGVAAGVAEHSDFRADPWRRLDGTLRSYLRIIYGSTAAARDEIRRLNTLHRGIHGPGYDARDPALVAVGPRDARSTRRSSSTTRGSGPCRASERGAVLRGDAADRAGVRRARRAAPPDLDAFEAYMDRAARTWRPGPGRTDRAGARRGDPASATPRGAGSAAARPARLRLDAVAVDRPPAGRVRDGYGLPVGPLRASVVAAGSWRAGAPGTRSCRRRSGRCRRRSQPIAGRRL